MPGWSGNWKVLFNQAPPSSSKLGINYIQASAASTVLELKGRSLVVCQDLAKHGIAGVVWNCARAMVSFFEAEPHFAAQRHVLELGAGPGAVGLALASACKVSSLLLTDLESVVSLTRDNAQSATQQHESIAVLTTGNCLEVRALRWGESLDDAVASRSVDVVVASDCLYESASHSALLTTLLELTTNNSQLVVLLAYKQRMPEKEKVFFESAAIHFDIAIYSKTRGDFIEYYDEAIYICKLERRCKGFPT